MLHQISKNFNDSYKEYGESNGLPSSLEEEEQWLKSVSFDDISDFITSENIQECMDIEKGNRLESLDVPIKVTRIDTDNRTAIDYEKNGYNLDLMNRTGNYTFPWQLISSTMLYKSFDPDYDSSRNNVQKTFKSGLTTVYFGLYGFKTTIVSPDELSHTKEFRFNRVVTEEINRKIRTRDVDYYWIKTEHGWKQKSRVSYSTTNETEKIIKEYPLPYFDKVSTYNEDITFIYSNRVEHDSYTTTEYNGNETITETHNIKKVTPYINKTMRSPNNERLIATLQAVGLTQNDIKALSQYVALMPGGVLASDELIKIGNLLTDSDAYFWSSISMLDYEKIMDNLNGNRYSSSDIKDLAETLLGLNYYWGGKYNSYGINDDWGSVRFEPTYRRYQKYGLDCSGYVDWVYYQLTGAVLSQSWGVRGQVENSVLIDKKDLRIGDLGFYHIYDKEYSGNHVGIFIGRDTDGKELFIHSGGSTWGDAGHPRGQVIISKLFEPYKGYKAVKFKHFGRPSINYTFMEDSYEKISNSTNNNLANSAEISE